MSLLLVSALALTLQTTPDQAGYDLFQLGACQEAGWALNRDAIGAVIVEQFSRSGQSAADFRAGMDEGAARAGAEFEATTAAISTQAEARAFGEATIARCDALTAVYPGILTRTSETETTWNGRLAGLVARYPE